MKRINQCFVVIAIMFLIHGLAFAAGPALTAKSAGNVDVLISRGSDSNYGNLQYANDGALLWAIGLRGISPAKSLFFHDEDAGISRMVIDGTSGNVGIGLALNLVPSYKLDVNGSIGATELHVNGSVDAISFTQISSRETKTAIEPMNTSAADDILDRLLAMELTTYEYKDEFGGDGRRHLGLIAEDVPSELQSGDGRGIDLYALMTYTIGALQAQQRQIEGLGELRSTNNQLTAEIGQLNAELAQLRQLVPDATSHRVVIE